MPRVKCRKRSKADAGWSAESDCEFTAGTERRTEMDRAAISRKSQGIRNKNLSESGALALAAGLKILPENTQDEPKPADGGNEKADHRQARITEELEVGRDAH